MEIVKVCNLEKTYGDFHAVKDISFNIEKGEIFGFLGPNGAGKTSTINMMIGLSRPTKGSIYIDGVDVVKRTKKAQRIMGIVADESNLYPEMNAFENLCFCASLYGMRKDKREKRASELIKKFNLESAAKKPFKLYSKGMRRKLTIAAGIIHSPKILFLDEPTTGIDVNSARQIRSLILDLKKQGTTVFITTHYIEDAQRICDKIAFIVDGKIVKNANVNELMKNTDSKHSISLTADKDINLIKEELVDKFNDLEFKVTSENTCIVTSLKRISLFPIIKYLDTLGISVFEAKEIRPSLEDVFVNVTGIGASTLKKEKEGFKR